MPFIPQPFRTRRAKEALHILGLLMPAWPLLVSNLSVADILSLCLGCLCLVQSDKVRPIDDVSVNSAFCAQSKLDLDGVDGISALARAFLAAVRDDGAVSTSWPVMLAFTPISHTKIGGPHTGP